MSDTQFWVTVGIGNFIVFSLYGYDKLCAINGYDRISEFTLLFLAFAFGGVGALLGMVLWRHKTLKIKFKLAIPFALLWSVYAVGFGYGLWVK